MKLYQLIKDLKCRVYGSLSKDIFGMYHHHKDVKTGGLFFCLKGVKSDGFDYVKKAICNGAVAIVSEKELGLCGGITQILVSDARVAMSVIAKNYYGNPASALKLIGVTGTNGKTTTTHMIGGLLNDLNYKSAIIGTSGVVYKNKKLEDTGMTTPDPIDLHRILFNLKNLGVEYVCMEVSAHAIDLKKLEGLRFEIMIFSNLTEDHLDYFKTMEKYYCAKKRIFSKKYIAKALINIDDWYGGILKDGINLNAKTYSIDNISDYQAVDLGVNNFKQVIELNGLKFESGFIGKFNIYNIVAALACLDVLKIKVDDVQKCVLNIPNIPGRFNTIVIKNKLFIIDYAHTPDGLKNVLIASKLICKEGKLICVFGCGGNRETQKRKIMGEISSKIADFTIITSDNPRFEDPSLIAKDIESGICGDKYKIILDRKKAIEYADVITVEGDVILIAGKGAESCIEIKGDKIPYSDFEEVEKLRG